jgi:hypothetical protein
MASGADAGEGSDIDGDGEEDEAPKESGAGLGEAEAPSGSPGVDSVCARVSQDGEAVEGCASTMRRSSSSERVMAGTSAVRPLVDLSPRWRPLGMKGGRRAVVRSRRVREVLKND